MIYTLDELNNILLRMQSVNYNRYQHHTAADILIELLASEQIADYWEIEWAAFHNHIYEASIHQNKWIITDYKLDKFLYPIISRAEKVRILTFFRDNAQEVLFNSSYDNVFDFKKYCAKLINDCIQQSRNDTYHGDFAVMPRPNLIEIAQPKPLPELCKENQIIADNLPSYPRDLKLFHKSIIVSIACEFTTFFRNQATVYNRTKENDHKPIMSIQKYKEPIRDRLIQAANRYLYFDEGPIYQTMWAICLMLRMIPNPNWWEKNCAENFLNYLSCTKFFHKSKVDMDMTMQKIRQLTEQTIPFDDQPTTIKHVQQSQPAPSKDMQLVDIAAYHLQMASHERPIIYAQKIEIGNVDTLINDNHGKIQL